ncbi:pantoate--beta-alanine ligase [Desulfovibrio legallii]|uniref:Pantothenate synthetase n=1 Tax=Desulfovibrio legallii TaxID=571438 RepID=A0A6H3FAV3_9BACT|nr:pantoate--beta-alanine ligase [Desulfovibrio legallii]RHH23020.1 pantoate--beta-alanine ligase [Desulfovibrio sp. AM18-2]TBH79478.1 pantoate--beta-alanine ligase [Desulfovibrio legallii]CAI3240074.1 Pantoate--beta-alanine ligase (EC [Desulfovibrio diazotrophicus]
MQILTTPHELEAQCRAWRKAGDDIALVPTMGYYHAGHEDLMTHARGLARRLVVSLFVNPTQFGPGEDLEAYPRDPERDAAIAAAHGADVLFRPEPGLMYAPDHATWVEVPELAKGLCGQTRPVHFRGVCTVVLKLFLLTGADVAVFGQKDWQQQAILRRMARDLNVPVRIVTRPTVREADGLALSSRNLYLTPEERAQAPEIRQGLLYARKLAEEGETSVSLLREAVLRRWAERLPLGRLDYLSVVHPESLAPLTEAGDAALMACAVRMGKARLIDNILLRP